MVHVSVASKHANTRLKLAGKSYPDVLEFIGKLVSMLNIASNQAQN